MKKEIREKVKKFMKSIDKNFLSDKLSIDLKFLLIHKRKINWKNPKSFNEKIQWRKLYDRKPFYTMCADRFRVRDYITKKIGKKHLIPLLYVGKPENIPFDKLKPPFVIKSTHNMGEHYFVKNKEDYEKTNIEEVKNYFSRMMKKNFYPEYREWHYKNIKPQIVVEKLILDKENLPEDYKINCFNGKAKYIQVVRGRDSENPEQEWYDEKWNRLNITNEEYSKQENPIKRPANLNGLIKIAEKLSKDFDYVRVDLYSVNNKIYFGELTLTPAAGFQKLLPYPYWDYEIGKKWTLKKEDKTVKSKK